MKLLNSQILIARLMRDCVLAILILSWVVDASAMQVTDTDFTYQGRLSNNGASVDGDFEMSFALFDAETAGAQVGATLDFDGVGGNPPEVTIADGLFHVSLDFGALPYSENASLWLEISVAGTTLTPRQRLTAAPHSLTTRGIEVDADGNISGQLGTAIGNDAFLELGGGGPYPNFERNHDFSQRTSDFSNSNLWSSLLSVFTIDPGADLNAAEIYGNSFELHSAASSDKNVALVNGLYGGMSHRGSGTMVNATGGFFYSGIDGPGNIAFNYGLAVNAGSGFSGQGSVTKNYGVTIQAGHPGTSGSIDDNFGLHIQSPANTQPIENNYGIFIEDQAVAQTMNYSIYSEGGDVYFNGDLDVTGSLSKGGGSFKIDHPLDPENKFLYHSFVESPDMMNVYNGNVILDDTGSAVVTMPDWFEALNREFRYQLTCIGSFAPVYVSARMKDNQFQIAGGKPGIEVSWQVTGVRQDAWAEANRIPVEVDKSDHELGRYLHPIAFGRDRNSGTGATRNPGRVNQLMQPKARSGSKQNN